MSAVADDHCWVTATLSQEKPQLPQMELITADELGPDPRVVDMSIRAQRSKELCQLVSLESYTAAAQREGRWWAEGRAASCQDMLHMPPPLNPAFTLPFQLKNIR